MTGTKADRLYGRGLTSKQILELFDSNVSLASIYRDTGVSPQTASKIVKASGRVIKRDIPAVETIIQLEELGITRDIIYQMYIVDNCNFADLRNLFSDTLKRKISDKTTTAIIRKMSITKSKHHVKELQGARSRAEFASNLAKLKKAGFATTAELAKYYEDNLSLTRNALVKQLNSALSAVDEPFTMRWLDRHMDPHLSEGRLKGTSRVEKEFIEILKGLTTSKLISGSFSIIPPYQLDTYLPDLNVAIEFNGNYWHSDKFLLKNHEMTSLEYHTMKLERCNELGIKLFFVWESDWYNSPDLIISLLKEILEDSSKRPEILEKLTMDLPPKDFSLAA